MFRNLLRAVTLNTLKEQMALCSRTFKPAAVQKKTLMRQSVLQLISVYIYLLMLASIDSQRAIKSS